MTRNQTIGIWFVMLAVGLAVFFSQTRVEEEKAEAVFAQLSQTEQAVSLKEVQVFNEALLDEGALYEQVREEMKNKGYAPFRIIGNAYTADRIALQVQLQEKAATAENKEEIQLLFTELIIKNGLTPSRFDIEVSSMNY
ncbi:hypothetical protein P6709_10305 [Jeotgalibacillus sp. ET6]|uniref:hypothetical protein n=1 Tax=Jeotgalibacillus sp. ET6 TaxID=3037260 RepID=UPI0024185E7E|nr:hypothetical protein [Jeotgalibacillus sp. ET6]MDG5472143.1 hypothetical protein [Jeotgalibacillus sp. ET6]